MVHRAWYCLEEVSYCFFKVIRQFQGHTAIKFFDFEPNWAFPDCNYSLNWPIGYEMMQKAWSSIEEVPYFFQGHPSKFKVTRLKKSSLLTQIGRFGTVTQAWIHRWIWNDAQSLKQHRIGALLFFNVIRQISRTHGTYNCRFWPELSVFGR